jgi:hypothetical protein
MSHCQMLLKKSEKVLFIYAIFTAMLLALAGCEDKSKISQERLQGHVSDYRNLNENDRFDVMGAFLDRMGIVQSFDKNESLRKCSDQKVLDGKSDNIFVVLVIADCGTALDILGAR